MTSDRSGPGLVLSGFEAGLGHENGDCHAWMSKFAYRFHEFWQGLLHGTLMHAVKYRWERNFKALKGSGAG